MECSAVSPMSFEAKGPRRGLTLAGERRTGRRLWPDSAASWAGAGHQIYWRWGSRAPKNDFSGLAWIAHDVWHGGGRKSPHVYDLIETARTAKLIESSSDGSC